MDNKEYNKLKEQVEQKYQKAVCEAEKRRNEGLEAIERVWDLLKEAQEAPPVKVVDRAKTKEKLSYGSFIGAIKEAIKLVPAKFTKKDIKLVLPQVSKEIADSCKDASLTGCLIRLEKQGIIKKIKGGRGSSPSLYQKMVEVHHK